MAISKRKRAMYTRYAIYTLSILAIVVMALLVDWTRLGNAMFKWEIVKKQFPDILTSAAKNTVVFTILGFAGGLSFGLLFALMRLSSIRPYRWLAATYIEIFRGIPLLVTLLALGFGIPIATGWSWPNPYLQGAIPLSLVASAYMAETIRAGIEAVPKGQMEAARSLGMSYPRAMITIIIPQALRIIVPPLTNEFVLLIKDTSLISVLGVTAATKDLARFGRDGVNSSANATPLIVAGLVYLAMTLPLTQLVAYMERRAKAAGK
ncbi:MAG: amino acid ABC transporter permease [Ilumatobacteraceae bacterium]|jgi:polar amino acid transport system permease protein|nr:amino acid ABC transporter permease [Ilumatobacteraceae bacterium]